MIWEIRQGDALELLREMPEASVDAIVTDPPYALGFMGKAWDSSLPGVEFWAEALRVAKPGAHVVAFGGSRTYHRLACAIEDAGWEVRDCLMWLYGSGFPKSLDVSKAIDKAAGAEREMKAVRPGAAAAYHANAGNWRPWMGDPDHKVYGDNPVTASAQEWQGWGTALKPAHEPIILARKPLAGTVAANVLEHGTGALNIDGCRVPTSDTISVSSGIPSSSEAWNRPWHSDPEARERRRQLAEESRARAEKLGRWPANVLLDSEAAEALDEQAGPRGGGIVKPYQRASRDYSGSWPDSRGGGHDSAPGRASRFFYTAKASAGERHAQGRNAHPTVKPVDLMRWLCRLVTPRGGLVLDPFTGSGSTGVAALAEGFRFLGCEREADYCATARRRIAGPLFAEATA